MTKDELIASISKSNKVIVDFWAPWCSPCRMLSPILEDIKNDLDVTVIKVNVDENENLAKEYNIQSIPALFIYKEGNLVTKSIGLKSKESIIELLK